MFNFRLKIEYDGTGYCGWQAQDNPRKKSIQEVLEKTLQKILREKVRLNASGRTDAGVHALKQVANFKTKSKIPLEKLQLALNGLLPDDISVCRIEKAPAVFHSRFLAKSKTYRYTILNRRYPSPLYRNTSYFYPHPLDVKIMRREARGLLGRHDFKSFQAHNNEERSSVRTIQKIKIAKRGDFIYIDIRADGFLYNMARNISGTLIKIACGRLPGMGIKKILAAKDRRNAGPTAPAKGLCLMEVTY